MFRRSGFIPFAIALLIPFSLFAPLASADSLSIVYTSSQNQTAIVGTGFTPVIFTGYVVNNTTAPITFQLTYVLGPPSSFYVAGVTDGVAYPGITLGGLQSTPVLDLVSVNLNPFDPSLTYPAVVSFSLEAISLPTGSLITVNDASIHVQTSVPEPSSLALLATAVLAGYFATRLKVRI
jgi:hypothetical protein